MKSTEVHLTFTYYFGMILTALLVQFGLAAFLLGLNWDALTLAQRSDGENLQALETYNRPEGEGMPPADPGSGQIARPNPAVLVDSAPGQASGMELGIMTPRHRPSHRASSPDRVRLDLGAATMELPASAGHSEASDSYDRLEPDNCAQSPSENALGRQDSDLYTTRRCPTSATFDSHSSQRPLLPVEDPD